MQNKYHESVLLKEVIDLLQIKKGKKYIDATLGGGGHAEAILELGGEVLGIDLDQDAIDFVSERLKSQISNGKLKLIQGNFKEIDNIARLQELERVDGIIFDLGVSSYQIENKNRGFSFQREGALDMRMDQRSGQIKANDLLNLLSREKLYEIFNKFGEEPRAHTISNAIVRTRRIKAIETNLDLLKIIKEAYGIRGQISDKTRSSISKRVFQALRIFINSELENLEESLPKAIDILEARGRVAVISFHSLEDRIVKQSFLNFEREELGKIITKKPIILSLEEQKTNRRGRSAKLRVFEKS